ncbi:hypothetical protein MMC14_010192 [Varicellaria rhodocarpa]|nr:hypothetical protein [Varicellaria rhodocarpa]
MTASSPNLAYPGRNNLGEYHGHPQTHPWRSAPVTGTAQYIHEMEQATTTALHRRIAVLETQLAQAQADKIVSEQTTRYLLQMASTSQGVHQSNIHSEELEAELRHSKATNVILHDKLHKAVHSWGNNVQSQREASYNESVIEIQENISSQQSHYINKNILIPGSKDTPVDLLDVIGFPDCLPELDFSGAGSSSTTDDLDSLDTFSPGLPKIDLRLYNTTDKEHNLNLAPELAPEPACLSHLRMFTNNSHTSSVPECVNPLVNSNLAKLDPDNTLKLQTQTVSQGNSGPLRTINVPNVGAARQQPDTPSDTLISEDSNTPCKSTTFSKQHITLGPPTSSFINNRRAFSHTSLPQITIGKGLNSNYYPSSRRFATTNQSICYKDLPYCKHIMKGVQYSPADKQDMLHTVTITGIPPKTTNKDLLSNIRGGIVVSMNLVNTVSITGTLTALVKFLYEQDTLAFYNFTKNDPLQIYGRTADVTMLATPSWPLAPSLRQAILEKGHTRCLEVQTFPRNVSPAAFRIDLRTLHAVTERDIEHTCMRLDGTLELRFTSISAAGRAHELLTTTRKYNSCQVKFTVDPCSLPLHATKPKAQVPVPKVVPAEERTQGTRPSPQASIAYPPSLITTTAMPSSAEDQSSESKTGATDSAVTALGLNKSVWAPTGQKPTSIITLPEKQQFKPTSTNSPRGSPTIGVNGKICDPLFECTYCWRTGHVESHCYENPKSPKFKGNKAEHWSPNGKGKGRELASPCVSLKDSGARPSPRMDQESTVTDKEDSFNTAADAFGVKIGVLIEF